MLLGYDVPSNIHHRELLRSTIETILGKLRRHVDKLDAATSDFPTMCNNPTHLFCVGGFECSWSAVIHSWYLFIDKCIKNGVPKSVDDIDDEDKAFGSPYVFALAIRHDRFTCVKPWYAPIC